MEKDYLKRATDPLQYDLPAIDWKKAGHKDSPSRLFFKECLEKVIDVKMKSVLDVGSGIGQLYPFLKKHGATKIYGVEPSKNNVCISRELNPDMKVFECSLENFSSSNLFDVVILVMVFEHIKDIHGAFSKINKLLPIGGHLYAIVGDKKYHTNKRFDYKIDTVDIGDGEIATKTTYSFGLLYDIFRPLENYIVAGLKNGFTLEKNIGLRPTKSLLSSEPKYLPFSGTTICHLLVFKKEN